MAKQEIKEYVEGRLRTLLTELEGSMLELEQEKITSNIKEILHMASHFNIKTKAVLNSHPLGKQFKRC